jgi:hypothetical protein
MPTLLETLTTYRHLARVVDAPDLGTRDPAGIDLAKAAVSCEATPFAKLIAAIDAYFDGELDDALTCSESAKAETEARRIIAEHLAAATMRLALSAAAASQVDWTAATSDALQHLAGVAFQRAADVRFTQIVGPLFEKSTT